MKKKLITKTAYAVLPALSFNTCTVQHIASNTRRIYTLTPFLLIRRKFDQVTSPEYEVIKHFHVQIN